MTLKVVGGSGAVNSGGRWLKIGLVVSLMLNAGLVGAFAAGMWMARRPPMHGHAPIERGLIGFVREMPRERSRVLLDSVEGLRDKFRALRRDLHETRSAAFEAFVAPSVDKDALKGALARAGSAEAAMQDMSTQLFVELAGRMTAEERLAYRKWRERQEPPRGPKDGHAAGKVGEGRP